MERYYKTIRDSKTGLKIKALLDKADEFDKQVAVLREKYGFGKTWTFITEVWISLNLQKNRTWLIGKG